MQSLNGSLRTSRNKKQPAHRKNKWKIAVLACCLAIGFLAVQTEKFGSTWRMLLRRPNFADARKDYTKRQLFLDNLVDVRQIPGCEGVIYDHYGTNIVNFYQRLVRGNDTTNDFIRIFVGDSLNEMSNGDYDLRTPGILERDLSNFEIPIFAGRKVFEGSRFNKVAEEDLRAIIIAHEGYHIKQQRDKIFYLPREQIISGLVSGLINSEVLYYVGEYDAQAHEFATIRLGKIKVSKEHYNRTFERLKVTEDFLKDAYQTSSTLQQAMISNVFWNISKIQGLKEFYR